MQAGKKLIFHGYVPEVMDGGECARCGHRLKDCYMVSYGGEQPTHRLCPGCHSYLKASYASQYSKQEGEG
jgi:hypothetical protein